jgi:8-oxo-dGTP pyrophosphatase MutT (NUDIX family)
MSPEGQSAPSGTAPRTIAELLGRFAEGAPPIGTAGAAVTIVLRDGAHEVEALLIERAENPNDPASGQVGLPGGHVEESDSSMGETALRELLEEVGLRRVDLTSTPRYFETRLAARFHLKVSVFAAELAPSAPPPSAASVGEVAHVFWLPRSALDHERLVARDTPVGRIEVPAVIHDGHILWGFTRRLLRDFFGYPTDDDLSGPPFAPHSREGA